MVIGRIVAGAAAAGAVLLFGAAEYFYRKSVNRSDKSFLVGDPDLVSTTSGVRGNHIAASAAWLAERHPEEWTVRADDGITLRASYLKADRQTKRLAVLVHGYSGDGSAMAGYARLYRDKLGFDVLMPDMRGHGRSGGHYIGFGWHDRFDIIAWTREAIERLGADCRIVLHGVSMGGSAVLMASGEALPDQVKCIVSDCAYSSVKDILAYQMRRMYRLPAFPLLPLTSFLTRLRAGYSFGEASALRQTARSDRPILFIHGGNDTFVPTAMVRQLYEAKRQGPKELLIVPDAGHAVSYDTDPEAYAEAVARFTERYI